jgi:DNA polymerase
MVHPSAEDYLPARMSLAALRQAAAHCQGCELYKHATQTVFGAGNRRPELVLVGEVPGDEEDKEGKPFVGPAGRLLDRALAKAEIARKSVYLTKVVKHFRWYAGGKRRLHKKPTTRQIQACKPWLQAEVLVLEPPVIVCLGATAAQTILGKQFRITRDRGKLQRPPEDLGHVMGITATYHPSAVLRAPDPADREQKFEELVDDLRAAYRYARDGHKELSAASR